MEQMSAPEQLIRDMYPKAPKVEVDKLLHLAEVAGLDPVQRQGYLISRGGKWNIQAGIDGFRAVAEANGLAGIDDAVFKEDEKGNPLAATVAVYKWGPDGQRASFTATARMKEYNAGGQMWKRMPHTMLAKCAEALALRKGFSKLLGGLYTADEMDQAGPGDDVPDSRPKVAGKKKASRRKAPPRAAEAAKQSEAAKEEAPAPAEEPAAEKPAERVETPEAADLRVLLQEATAASGVKFPKMVDLALTENQKPFNVTKEEHRLAIAKVAFRLKGGKTPHPSNEEIDAALRQALEGCKDDKAKTAKLLAVVDEPGDNLQRLDRIQELAGA
ncbi:MAG: hypothetical protein B7733_20700 [Myxococcales bacterium FL481]|nr:MAG: hypothetical protein B7733_20700 [Myxococcales bacterium FL481]